jgi:hypothetical protein
MCGSILNMPCCVMYPFIFEHVSRASFVGMLGTFSPVYCPPGAIRFLHAAACTSRACSADHNLPKLVTYGPQLSPSAARRCHGVSNQTAAMIATLSTTIIKGHVALVVQSLSIGQQADE